jgi:16S rRNA (guanine527-N7)-methyltransferase
MWVLPKGKNWQNELDIAQPLWQSVFHVEQSVTDPESAILVVRGVKKKG